MAEAILNQMAGDRFDVFSAGLKPSGVHPLTVKVLDEIGIDTSDYYSKGIEKYLGVLPVQYLIVVCKSVEGECPKIWPGMVEMLFWPFDDPAAYEGTYQEKVEAFRRVRDDIREKIATWLKVVVSPK